MSDASDMAAAQSHEPQAEAGGATDVLTHKTLTYRVVRFSMHVLLRVLFRARVEGREHVPDDGPIVIVSNHQSLLDIPLIAMSTRRHVCFVARDTLAHSRPLAWLMRQCGAVLVKRGSADRAALKAMLAHLERGDALAVFAEGTRSRDGRVGAFRPGAALAARRARVPLVPAAVRGGLDVWPRGSKLPRLRRMAVRYGPAIDGSLPDALERAREAIVAAVGDGGYRSVPEQR